MAKVSLFKVLSLPAEPVANALYFVETGSEVAAYATSATGVAKRMVGPKAFATFHIVADLAERDTLSSDTPFLALVLDATADSTVDSGAALYAYDPTLAAGAGDFIKVAEFESMDLELAPKWLVGDTGGVPVEKTGRQGVYVHTLSTSGATLDVPVSLDGTLTGNPIFANLAECEIGYEVLKDTVVLEEAVWGYLRTVGSNQFQMQLMRSNDTTINALGGTAQGNVHNDVAVQVRVTVKGVLA